MLTTSPSCQSTPTCKVVYNGIYFRRHSFFSLFKICPYWLSLIQTDWICDCLHSSGLRAAHQQWVNPSSALALGQRPALSSLTTPVLACFKPIGPRPLRRHYKAARIRTQLLLVVVSLCCCHPPPSPSPCGVCMYYPSGGIITLFAHCLIVHVCC